ncbi:MAG TPA: hypothetical protein VHZ81_06735 [Galbitalea sp.]|jgi:hypothetical protein|nr:hypothetical protein [Galbitalea sp.]
MTFMDIVGADRGFNVHADILTTTIDGADLNGVWDELVEALGIFNASRDPIVALMSYNTTLSAEALPLDPSTMNFELASEFGIPTAGRSTPKTYVVGYPLEWYDLALRYTARFLRDAPSSQITAQHIAAQEASDHLLFRNALTTLTTPALLGSRFVNEEGASIYSLYAGSSDDAPPSFAGKTFSSDHNHYLVSGAATVDGQDLDDLISTIAEHGFGINVGEKIVILVHPDQGRTIRGFRAGVADSPYDFIPSEQNPAYLSTEFIVGDLPPATFNGLDVIGSFGSALIVESYFALSGYLVGIAVAGGNSPRNALAIRSHPRPELKGLTLTGGSNPRYPLFDSGYSLGVGFGVRNRGAAAVVKIAASGSYTAPTVS